MFYYSSCVTPNILTMDLASIWCISQAQTSLLAFILTICCFLKIFPGFYFKKWGYNYTLLHLLVQLSLLWLRLCFNGTPQVLYLLHEASTKASFTLFSDVKSIEQFVHLLSEGYLLYWRKANPHLEKGRERKGREDERGDLRINMWANVMRFNLLKKWVFQGVS